MKISYNKLKKDIFNLELLLMEISGLKYDINKIRVNLEDSIFGKNKKDNMLEIISDSIVDLKFISKHLNLQLKEVGKKIDSIKNDFEV